MTEKFVVRATAKDKAELQVEAQKMGMDVSGLIRHILIREKILSPM